MAQITFSCGCKAECYIKLVEDIRRFRKWLAHGQCPLHPESTIVILATTAMDSAMRSLEDAAIAVQLRAQGAHPPTSKKSARRALSVHVHEAKTRLLQAEPTPAVDFGDDDAA